MQEFERQQGKLNLKPPEEINRTIYRAGYSIGILLRTVDGFIAPHLHRAQTLHSAELDWSFKNRQ